jgi:hypothetical protein
MGYRKIKNIYYVKTVFMSSYNEKIKTFSQTVEKHSGICYTIIVYLCDAEK